MLLPRLSGLHLEQRWRDGGSGLAEPGLELGGLVALGEGAPAGGSRHGGRGFLPFPLPEPGRLKSAFVDGAAESASPGESPASARDSRSVKSSRRMAIVLRAAPAIQTLFPVALIPHGYALGTSVGGTRTTKGLMLGAERRRRRKEGRKRCPVPGKATKQKMNQGGGRAAGAWGGGQAKTGAPLGEPGSSTLPDRASTRPFSSCPLPG